MKDSPKEVKDMNLWKKIRNDERSKPRKNNKDFVSVVSENLKKRVQN